MKKITLIFATAILTVFMAMTAFAGTWKQDAKGWWWDRGNGTWPVNGWEWCDGNNDGTAECFYFGPEGYCLINTTTPDGYTVDANGAWIVNGVVQTKKVASSTSTADSMEDIAGRYDLYGGRMGDAIVFARDINGKGYLTLKKDGTGRWSFNGASSDIDWDYSAPYLTIYYGAYEVEGFYNAGTIELLDYGQIYASNKADLNVIGAIPLKEYTRRVLEKNR